MLSKCRAAIRESERSKMSRRCAIYSRVSTDAQEREGTSLDTQERACVEYAKERDWECVELIRDAASGFTLEREGLARLRKLANEGLIDAVLCFALDRLSRKQTHVAILVEEMDERDICLEFVTEKFEDTATGQLLRSVKAFAAEFEREKIAERTMRGKAERARSGRMPQATGRGIYGYYYNQTTGKREINEEQAVTVRRIFTEFAGGASIVGIANALNLEGVPTLQGKSWSPATLFHLLHNESYTGKTTYRRSRIIKQRDPDTGRKRRKIILRPTEEWIEIVGATPAIISSELFTATQVRLRDPERLRHGRRISTYGLAGRVKCSHCGASMVGQTLSGRYRYYRCRRAFAGAEGDRCHSYYVRADALEQTLLTEIARVLSRPDVVREELNRVGGEGATVEEETSIKARLESLDRQHKRLLKLYQMGEIDDPYLERESDGLRRQRDELVLKLQNLERPAASFLELADLEHICESVRDWVLSRGSSELELIGRALSISISADREGCHMRGTLPEYSADCNHADVRPVVMEYFGGRVCLGFLSFTGSS